MLLNPGLVAPPLENQFSKELIGKERLLYFGRRQEGVKINSCSRTSSPPLTISGKSLYRLRDGATCKNSSQLWLSS